MNLLAQYSGILVQISVTIIAEIAVYLLSQDLGKDRPQRIMAYPLFRDFGRNMSQRKITAYVILINLLTWPLAVLALQYLNYNLFVIEMAVTLVESVLIMLLLETSFKQALLISFIANLVSFCLGMDGVI